MIAEVFSSGKPRTPKLFQYPAGDTFSHIYSGSLLLLLFANLGELLNCYSSYIPSLFNFYFQIPSTKESFYFFLPVSSNLDLKIYFPQYKKQFLLCQQQGSVNSIQNYTTPLSNIFSKNLMVTAHSAAQTTLNARAGKNQKV